MFSNFSAVILAVLVVSVISAPSYPQDDADLELNDIRFYNDIDDGRSANEKPASRWPGGVIPLNLDSKFDKDEVEAINTGIQLITSRTNCLSFRQATTSDDNYIQVVRGEKGSGCFSDFVGKSRNKVAKVNLQAQSYCMRPGTIAHEFLHVAGLYHEMTRPDRDDWVRIVWDNMEDDRSTRYQFERRDNSLTYGVSYDYGSIMHYPDTAGSKNGKPTMVKRQRNSTRMGQREKPSENDIAIINAMYCEE